MKRLLNPREHLGSIGQLLTWTALVLPVAVLSGSASALFLWALDRVTRLRWENPWLLWLLPAAGVVVGLLYHLLGQRAEGGNNLIMDEIHEPGGGVPARMAPLVLVGTLLTHLFGGSAGREGTAVQMGGSLAGAYGRIARIGADNRRVLLMAGVAAGFGSVFGTPLTGAIFAMEVLVIGRMDYTALIPVLVASVVGDVTCSAWGIRHAVYHIDFAPVGGAHALFDGTLMAKVIVAAMAFGLASQLFSELTHGLQTLFKRAVPYAPLRPAVGGALVIAFVWLLGTRDYLGIGVTAPDPGATTILSAFTANGATPWSWWWKLLLTALTLASGFKGGEVTPLFFIGATLGHTLAGLLGAPVDLLAGLGFIAVFAGATNTPLACTMMGLELFGAHHVVYFAVACFVAYFFSGHSGIYGAQRVGVPKPGRGDVPHDLPLRDVRAWQADTARLGYTSFAERFPFTRAAETETLTATATLMQPKHNIVAHEMGKLRIYLTPRERLKADGLWARLNARPIYREIIRAAKRDGLHNAVAFTTHFGFSNRGDVQGAGAEAPNPQLTLCVELIGYKDALETFCRRHGELLKGKTIVYKHVEHWSLHEPDDGLDEEDASPDESLDGAPKQPIK
jgi:H+/Cl- antiporter ClcA/PII-like signaling protein